MKVKYISDFIPNIINSYEESVNTFNSLSDLMDDTYLAYRVNQHMMCWINNDGQIGEIECIYPSEIKKEKVLIGKHCLKIKKGFPILDMSSNLIETSLAVFNSHNYFIMYLSEDNNYSILLETKSLVFYLNGPNIVAIKAIKSV